LQTHVRPEPEALVFTGPKEAPLRRAGFRRLWWRPAVVAAGLDNLKLHKLRHTFVSLCVAAGADAKMVSVRDTGTSTRTKGMTALIDWTSF
jgi:site-specific recombinase XerD